jgi:hypothetical protein
MVEEVIDMHATTAQERHEDDTVGARATRLTVSAIGALIALAGIEHGVGEVLQGNVAPTGVAFESWPVADAFRVLGGEPAMTVVPNLLATGVLAILASLLFLVWATAFVRRKPAGLVLILLSVVMLLVGAGFGPPLVGVLLGIAATRIDAPLTWWRSHLPSAARRILAALWPWLLGADVIAWVSLVPGVVVVGSIFGGDAVSETLVYAVIVAAFGFLLLALVGALARDMATCSIGRTPGPGLQSASGVV